MRTDIHIYIHSRSNRWLVYVLVQWTFKDKSMMKHQEGKLLLLVLVAILACDCHGYAEDIDVPYQQEITRVRRQSECSVASMCRSKWGFCGYGSTYCGEGCQAGPCTSTGGSGGNNGHSGDIINEKKFQCVFKTIDGNTRSQRLEGLRKSGWKPHNKDEAAVFLAHVYHETDGLKTLKEYCAPGEFHRANSEAQWGRIFW